MSETATPEEIKKAYRKKAKTAHPDAGGDPEEFNLLSRSAAVLLDPIKREKFDRTGKMNDAPDTQQTEIMQLLSTLLISVIQADFDLAMTDLRTVIRSRLKVDREKLLEARDQLTKAKFRIAVLLARLKPSKGGGNVSLIELTEQHQRAVNLEAEKLEAKIEVYAKAMAVVDDHGYEVTVPQSAYMSGNTTSSTFFNF